MGERGFGDVGACSAISVMTIQLSSSRMTWAVPDARVFVEDAEQVHFLRTRRMQILEWRAYDHKLWKCGACQASRIAPCRGQACCTNRVPAAQ